MESAPVFDELAVGTISICFVRRWHLIELNGSHCVWGTQINQPVFRSCGSEIILLACLRVAHCGQTPL